MSWWSGTTAEDARREKTALTWVEKVVIGSGVTAVSAFDAVRATFSTPFFLDVVGLDAIALGNITLITRLYDSFTDPGIAFVSDRVVTRWGRRRPWLVAAAVPLALSYYLIWTTAISTSAGFYLATFLLFETFCTMVNVPYLSLTSEMSSSYTDSITLSSVRQFSMNFANIFAVVGTQALLSNTTTLQEERDAYLLSATILSIYCIPSVLLAGFLAKEKADYRIQDESIIIINNNRNNNNNNNNHSDDDDGGGVSESESDPLLLGHEGNDDASRQRAETERVAVKDSFARNFGVIVSNRTYLFLLSVMVSATLAARFYESSLLLFAEHVLKIDGDGVTLLLFLQYGARASGVPVMWALTKKLGKKTMLTWGIAAYAVATVAVWWCNESNAYSFFIVIFVKGFFGQALGVSCFACMPDIVDECELRHGVRREASYVAVWNFSVKVTTSIALAFSSYLLAWAGYISDGSSSSGSSSSSSSSSSGSTGSEQPDSVILMLRIMQVVIPSAFLTLGLALGWFYDLTQEKHAEILRLLESRRRRRRLSSSVVN